MIMHDVGMIAADTTRSMHYIKALIKNEIFPNFIFLLINNNSEILPGQKSLNNEENLLNLLKNSDIGYEISYNVDINSDDLINKIKIRNENNFIYSGFGGVLLRDNILSIGKRFLHVHGGYLPQYKGSTTNYYSLINENMIGASSIFLTKEIDSGPILLRKKFDVPINKVDIDHIYDSEVRSQVLIETLDNYIDNGHFKIAVENNIGGETFYIIHPILKHIAILGS